MFFWIAIALFAAAGFSFWREPRRLRVGVLLLAAISMLILAVLAELLSDTDDSTNQDAAWILLGLTAVGLLAIIALALFLVYNGMVMLRRESRTPANMLSLLLGGALLVYVGTGFLAIASTDALLAVWLLLTVPPIAWLGFVFSAFLIYAWLYGRYARRYGETPSAIVVLGAGLIAGRVTPLLASRLARGQQLLERSRACGTSPRIIVSGGQGSDEVVPEGQAMAEWLVDRGVPRSDIVAEMRSRNTEENLRYSRELIQASAPSGPFAVVTSNYHAFRAATLMRSLGIDGYTVGAPTSRYFWPSAMIREFVALLRDNKTLNVIALVVLTSPLLIFTAFLVVGLFT